tara:strand:+ start:30 stop:569 length:540 start_codon:yes stop_codon:yes gene_type:complete
MERNFATACITNYADRYYQLTDYPPHELLRELTSDVNTLINYVAAYVLNVNNDAPPEIPTFMEKTLSYIVNFRAANFSSDNGGVIDMSAMLMIKAQVNQLILDYINQLSDTPMWFNHDLKFVQAGYNSTVPGIPDPGVTVMVELGEKKLGTVDYGFSHQVTPQILTAVEMLVLRYETSS